MDIIYKKENLKIIKFMEKEKKKHIVWIVQVIKINMLMDKDMEMVNYGDLV